MKFYDIKNQRLILIEENATNDFWEKHWQKNSIQTAKEAGGYFVKKITARFLNKGAKVLDGGCGDGRNVIALQKAGFESFGADFAAKAVEKAKENFPNLKIFCQDVCQTNFPDKFFDGYWSLGVIEHLWGGYDDIIKEARRILKLGGYFFVSFPHLSLLRKLKIFFKRYPFFQGIDKPVGFYEFIFDSKRVKKEISKAGFDFIGLYYTDSCKGLKSEIGNMRKILQKIYSSKSFLAKVFRGAFSFLFSWAFGHIAILVFKKSEK